MGKMMERARSSKIAKAALAAALAVSTLAPGGGLALDRAWAEPSPDGGTTSVSELIGVSRDQLIEHLVHHGDDYLGTAYKYDWPAPTVYETGPWWSDGKHPYESNPYDGGLDRGYGMNCAGFVARLYSDLGAENSGFMTAWWDAHRWHWANSETLRNTLIAKGATYYTFSSEQAMFDSGVLQKGDLIQLASASGTDDHVAMFWGDSPDEDKVWHSVYNEGSHSAGQNRISALYGKGTTATYYVIKFATDGFIDLQKASLAPGISDGNASYSLKGAVYGVFSDKDCTIHVADLVTDETGYAKSDKLSEGTYYVKETKAPVGYAVNGSVIPVKVVSGKTARVNGDKVFDAPQNDPADMIIGKVDAETTKNLPQGSASLAGAEYTVKYYDGLYDEASLPAKATRTWVLKTDKDGYVNFAFAKVDPDTYFVSGDDFYTDSFGKYTLPLGTVTVQETKAPAGYLLGTNGNAPLHLQQIKSVGDAETVETYNAPTDSEQVVRGDFDFNKVNGQNMARLANVAFSVSSDVTGESHVVVTDANGYVSTAAAWNAHSANTNANDAAVTVGPDGKTTVDESKLDPAAGVWFGTSAPDDGKGALPYDTYTVTELPGKANAGLELVSFKVTISRNAATVNLGTVDDNPLTPPAIRTTATDKASGSHEAQASSRTVIVDQVAYEGLTPGKTYTVEGTLMDKATGQALTVDGKAVRASKTFVPERAVGTVEVSFELDSSALAGKTTVVFEDVQSDGKSVAVHADITDEGQSVSFVGIGTTAADKADGDKEIEADKEQTIVDKVSYTGLVPGRTYAVSGTLMDKEGGFALLVDGKAVTSTKEFVPDAPDGTVEVEFVLDGSALAGKSIVVFEDLSRDGKTVASHADINDEGQTVRVKTKIRTTATDKASGSHEAQASSRTVIVDQVAYEGLTPGKTYTVEGTLMDKATGQALTVDGKAVRASKTFVPERAVGTVEVSFELDSSALAGKTTVVFEDVQSDGKSVAVHADITDEGQSVSFVGIGTTAADKADGDKEIEADKEQTIVDKVSYTGLVPGRTYAVSGTLMDKEGGFALLVDGKAVTSTKEFVPDAPDGTVEVEFVLDGSALAGKSIVVFEDLSRDGKTVASHADINDEGQTVRVREVPENPGGETYDKPGNLLEGAAPVAAGLGLAAAAAAAYGVRQRKLGDADKEANAAGE